MHIFAKACVMMSIALMFIAASPCVIAQEAPKPSITDTFAMLQETAPAPSQDWCTSVKNYSAYDDLLDRLQKKGLSMEEIEKGANHENIKSRVEALRDSSVVELVEIAKRYVRQSPKKSFNDDCFEEFESPIAVFQAIYKSKINTGEKLVSRKFYLQVLFANTREALPALRGKDWRLQEGARAFWASEWEFFALTKAELTYLGFTRSEIKQLEDYVSESIDL